MADGRKNNGGHSTKGRAGRPAKADEIKLAERIRNVISDDELLNSLAQIARDPEDKGRLKALELLAGYLYGRPTQRVENVELQELPEIYFVRATKKG